MLPQQLLIASGSGPPAILPETVALFLGNSEQISPAAMQAFWEIMKDVIWSYPTAMEKERIDAAAVRDHGFQHGFGESLLYGLV